MKIQKYIIQYNQKESKYIKLDNRMKYISPKEKYDIIIIEIKESDNINNDMFFEIELNENNIKYSKKKYIYTSLSKWKRNISIIWYIK